MRDESLGTWASEFYHSHTWDTAEATLVPELVYFSTNTAKLGAQEILAHPGISSSPLTLRKGMCMYIHKLFWGWQMWHLLPSWLHLLADLVRIVWDSTS